jgi:hypothetical protein
MAITRSERNKTKIIARTKETFSNTLDLVDEVVMIGVNTGKLINNKLEVMLVEQELESKIELAKLKVELDAIKAKS